MRAVSLRPFAIALAVLLATASLPRIAAQTATGELVPPAEFLGFTVGADNKLARWDRIVEYMRKASVSSDRVRFRELGKTSNGNAFILLEISAPETLKNLDRYKALQRRLYFQGGAPGETERDEITLGAASEFSIQNFPVPVRNLKRGLSRDDHFAPGTILRIEVDTKHPLGYGMAARTFGFYNNSPFFALVEGFASQQTSIVARYPNTDVVASGWLKGEELMAGRAAVISIEMNPGRIVLFGLRPQHRAQTHATFPMLFNALYLATTVKPGS